MNKRPKLPKFTTPQRELQRLFFVCVCCCCSNDIFIPKKKNWFRLLGVPFRSNDSFCFVRMDEFEYFLILVFSSCLVTFVGVVRIGLVGIGARIIINELRQNDYFKCNNHLGALRLFGHELQASRHYVFI